MKMERLLFVFILVFMVIGCKQFTRNSKQHIVEINKAISYKSRALKIPSNEFSFEQRITYRNFSYEPYPVDLLYVNLSSVEFEKRLADHKIKRIEDGKVHVENRGKDFDKSYIFNFNNEKWYLTFGYIYKLDGEFLNDYTEAGMQEFERIIEQLECQREKRGLLND